MSELLPPQQVGPEGFDPRKIFSQGFSLDNIDLIQGGQFSEVIGRTVITLLGGRDQEGKNPFAGVTVILPPKSATKLLEEAVHDALAAGVEALRGSPPDAEELEYLKRRIQILRCPTLAIRDLVAIVAQQGQRSLVAIADASVYQDEAYAAPIVTGLSAVMTAEDRWAPQVAFLCNQCVAAVLSTNSYALVHVAESPAVEYYNEQLLHGIEHCYVTRLFREASIEEQVEAKARRWVPLMLAGQVAAVLGEIETLQLAEVNRLHILAQLYSRADLQEEAIEAITQLVAHHSDLEPTILVQIAWLAHNAGNEVLARVFLPTNADSVDDIIWIERGLELATIVEDNSLLESYDARLDVLAPTSSRLRENRDRRLLHNCGLPESDAGAQFTTAGFSDKHLRLQDGVLSNDKPYGQIIDEAETWGIEWSELAVICCALHAFRLGEYRAAADAACQITGSELYGRQATQVTLTAVRVLMLKEVIPHEDRDYYRVPFQAVFRFIALHPGDGDIRSQLLRLLSVESCGNIGVPLAALTLLDLASDGAPLAISTVLNDASITGDGGSSLGPDEYTIMATIKKGLMWLSEQGAVESGVTVLPIELAPYPDPVIRFIKRLLLMSAPQSDDIDLEMLENLVMVVCATCPHAIGERNADLQVMRLFAGLCTTVDQYQQARNFAEQMLKLGQRDPIRARLAWSGYADVYHRNRNFVEALVGLACALATDAPVEKADLWQEIHTVIRVLRDLGLFDLAQRFLPQLKELTSDLGFDALNDLRIVFLEVSLRFMSCGDDPKEIGWIVAELGQACGRAMTDRSMLMPLVVLLCQAVHKADGAGLQIDPCVRAQLTRGLLLLGKQASQLIETVSAAVPTAAAVTELFNGVQRSLYAGDVASDLSTVAVVARRLLDDSAKEVASDTDKALAVELLADRAVVLGGVPPVMDCTWPVRYAQSLNQSGVDIAFLAVNSDDELSVTYLSEGRIQNIAQLQHPLSFKARLQGWLQEYPRKYGYVDAADGHNEFFTTMERLDITLPSSKALLVVAEPMLQQLTFNLIVVEPSEAEDGFSYFLGSKTAVGLVPSLTWLSMARGAKRNGRKAYKAWISAELGPELNGTLDLALSRLEGTFHEYNFDIDTGRELPREMSDAGLAVVTAHGGLTAQGRYIHSIRDEGSLIEAPAALASALAGVEVVILFVCSGGRVDKHPWGNTTVGLPKQLLNKGCRTVIASPWPLDVKVTYCWLEPFLREWEGGATALEATKIANEAVAKSLGDSPQYSLAMTVYGDVLLTK